MSWAKEGAATSARLRELTEVVRDALDREGASSDSISNENGGAASEGFVDGCDAYDAFMFVSTLDERSYCVTVEDVTIAKEDV